MTNKKISVEEHAIIIRDCIDKITLDDILGGLDKLEDLIEK